MKPHKKTCFFIAPLAENNQLMQKQIDNIIRNVVTPAVTELGYSRLIRTDKISRSDLITTKILKYVVESDLVIADLTEHHPSVYYALAIRHIIQKPVVHMIREGSELPYGFKNASVISVSPNIKKAKANVKQLKDQIRAVEKEPIDYTFIKDFAILKNSIVENPILPTADKQSLFDISRDMYSAIKVIEGQIAKLDNKVSTIRGDVRALQLASLPSPFIERRLAKFESIKYKAQQKGLVNTAPSDS